METHRKVNAFAKLGEVLTNVLIAGEGTEPDVFKEYKELILTAIKKAEKENPWFTRDNVFYALREFSEKLDSDNTIKWLKNYKIPVKNPQTIAVIMAGNIPFVGLHDFLCVLFSGHRFLGKLSSQDKILMPAIAEILIGIEPAFTDYIKFSEEKISGFDAVIATGSDNTSRYFEYYFGKYPHIIRKNRNSVAVLKGTESDEELALLGKDIFIYFGLGCRSVSKLYIPRNYNFSTLFNAITAYGSVKDHIKYANNYDYNKAIFLVNNVPHFDNGFLLLKQDKSLASPVSVIHFEEYENIDAVSKELSFLAGQVQCVVSSPDLLKGSIPFGTSQSPELWDYADGVDTMKFLTGLDNK